MHLTQKGQVTIPKKFREQFGIDRGSEVEFEATDRGVLIRPSAKSRSRQMAEAVQTARGMADAGLRTDEIMELTRG